MQILENIFQTAYSEYKEYETFFKNVAPKIKQQREEFSQKVLNNPNDVENLTEELFDNNTRPVSYQTDLINLQNRLLTTYETVKDVIEIPAEVKKEIETFIKPKQLYKIDKGEAIELDPEYMKQMKIAAKDFYKNQLQAFIKENETTE